jgi:hypothetical protein
MAITNTTKLEAVNTMLSAVGSSPINSLSGSQSADSTVAQNILDEVLREVLSQGWAFNYETKVELAPDSSSQINLSANVARIDNTPGYNLSYDIVQRGTRLYDRKSHSYTFNETLTCDIIYFLEYEELPEAARRYVMIRAARIFQDRVVGSANHHAYNMQDELKALADLKDHEGDTADHSIFHNWDVARVVNRPSALRGQTSIGGL